MIDFRCLIFWLFLDLGEHETQLFELPPELSDPQKSPCVNVPEWFVREGGELCLSESGNGTSVIRLGHFFTRIVPLRVECDS